MAQKPAITVRMGAAHWDISINAGHGNPQIIDMRPLDSRTQREVIFQVVKACRETGRVVT